MNSLKKSIKKNRALILLWAVLCAADLAVFLLYGIMAEPFWYALALGAFFLCSFLAVDAVREDRREKERARALAAIPEDWTGLPEAHSPAEEDYQKMIAALGTRLQQLTEACERERQESIDYYTGWVHQIKTPIAVMRLKLAEDTSENRALSAELFRIEQYVEMVLQYIRLGSSSNDLVIREYRLDELIRESIRKFAPQFVEKRLRLEYTPTEECVVTDRKWFCCILEQLLSNAVKYTPAGTVSIAVCGDRLTVSDTGIGIAEEDLPRIFEKGYTGNNGRLGQRSSGLGLYLAGKAAALLALDLSVESRVGEGSRFSLTLRRQ